MFFASPSGFFCLLVLLFLVVQQVSLAFSLSGSRLLLSDSHSSLCREKSTKVSLETSEQADSNCYANWNSNRSIVFNWMSSSLLHFLGEFRYQNEVKLFDRRKSAWMESQLATEIKRNSIKRVDLMHVPLYFILLTCEFAFFLIRLQLLN